MSLDSSFRIDAPGVTPAAAQALLIDAELFERLDDMRDAKRLFADGCVLSITRPTPPQFELEDLGIRATLHLIFANADKEKTQRWTLATIRAVMHLLHSFSGDALLLYSVGSPALLRKKGKLILDHRCGLWMPNVEPQVLPLVDLDYSWGTILLD